LNLKRKNSDKNLKHNENKYNIFELENENENNEKKINKQIIENKKTSLINVAIKQTEDLMSAVNIKKNSKRKKNIDCCNIF